VRDGARRSRRGPARGGTFAIEAGAWALMALACVAPARAQSIEPRLFANAPVGMNFLIVGYARSSGAVQLDSSIPLEDASIVVHVPFVAYARALGVGDLSAKLQVLVPYGWLSGEAVIVTTGQTATRDVDGLGDPSVRFAVNLHGAPALPAAEFGRYRQDLVVGVSLQVTAPFGQYDPDRLVNLGAHRWMFKPEVGISKALGRWILESTAGVNIYTDNDDFYGGQRREQAPIYSAQGHVIYNFRRGVWTALDATFFTGGRTTINGVQGDDLQKNWRLGFTLAMPVNRRNALKIYVSDGVYTRIGDDFVVAGVGWQYRWGGGA